MLLPVTVDPPERPIARDAHVDAAGAERLREVEGGFAGGAPAHPHHRDRHDEQRDTDERDHRQAETLLRRSAAAVVSATAVVPGADGFGTLTTADHAPELSAKLSSFTASMSSPSAAASIDAPFPMTNGWPDPTRPISA